MYEIVSPAGRPAAEGIAQSGSGLDLTGKRVGLVRIPFPNGDVLLETLGGLIGERFEGMEFVKLPSGRDVAWGDYPDDSLTEVVRESGIDAAMVAVGC